jgi:hypothetical protein
MKPVNIVLLVLAGALGGAVVMKVLQRPRLAQIAEVQTVEQSPAAVAPPATAPAVQAPMAQQVERSMAQPVERPATPIPVRPKAASTRPAVVKPAATRHSAMVTPPKHVELQRDPEPVERDAAATEPTQISNVQPPPAAAAAASLSPPIPEQPQETPPARMEPEKSTPVSAPIPSTTEPRTVTLNAGMFIPVRLLDGLSLDKNHAGDTFAATLDRELVANGFVIAERGARVEGRGVNADRGTRTLSIELTRITTSDRQDVPIQTERFDKHSEPDRNGDATKIAGGAVIGAVIGGIAGGGKGAAIGAGVGGGAGAGDVMLTRKPVALPSETRITFRLRAPVTLTERRN